MGLPFFENPHLLPQTTEHATRAELFSVDDEQAMHRNYVEDKEAVEELNKQLHKRVRYEIIAPTSRLSSKRRRLEDSGDLEGKEQEEQFVLFRLVSSLREPKLVSLLPAPSPPTLTRPPDPEDTEAQAALRKQRAEAASIDGETILQCASISQPETSSATTFASVRLRDTIPNPPRLMVLEKAQKLRKTRPPVPSSKLLYSPYTADAPPPSLNAPHKTKCLVVTIEEPEPESTTAAPHRRSRHLRKSKLIAQPAKNHPPPQFWRPSPGMKGKCRGYAFGYPGSLLAAAEARGHVDEISARKYKHDAMKKVRYIE